MKCVKHAFHCLLILCFVQGTATFSHEVLLWTHAFDFDGDGENDVVEVEYTGGAHCCYRLAVYLSSTNHTHRLPFLLDGGYVGGLDLSRPEHFSIRYNKGSLPEILMEIATYNGDPQPLPKEWIQNYGINTHHIAVGFEQGRISVRDWQWTK
jgi:hypothetical protein